MKKIFRFAMAFALAGATLLYAGCTKDYEKDIESVKAELVALQEGTIAEHSAQIEHLAGLVSNLDNVTKSLQTSVNNINTKIASIESDLDKKADKTALEAAKDELQGQITDINAAIETINDVLETKADKSWVEQTFATKEALEEVSEALGALGGTVTALNDKVNGIETELQNVKVKADEAYNDAKNALGQIENIWTNFDNYYTKGEIDALISNYYTKEETDGAISAAKTELQEEIAAKAEELSGKIDAVSESLDAEIEARIAAVSAVDEKIEQEIADRAAAVSALQEAVNAALEEINGKLAELAGRVNTLSVVPTQSPEIAKVVLGDQSSNLLIASVVVEPKSWAGKIVAENLKVYVEEALPRTKGVGTCYDAQILACDEMAGTVTVLVKGLEDLASPDVNAYFFAFEYTGSDSAGDYTVRSEYAQAVESAVEIDLSRLIVWFRTVGEVEEEISGTEVTLEKENIDYTIAAEYTDQPFQPFYPKFRVVVGREPRDLTVAEIEEMFGIRVVYNDDVATVTEGEFEAEEPCVTISQEGFDAETTCVSDDFSLQVGERTTGSYTVQANGVPAGLVIRKTYEIVPHIVCEEEELAEIYVPWNYQTYDSGFGEVKKDDLGGHWVAAIEDGATAKAEATITPEADFVFGNWVAEQTQLGGDYPDDLNASEVSFSSEEQNFVAFIEKQNVLRYYSFNVPIRVAAAMADQSYNVALDDQDFTITGENDLVIGNFSDLALQDEEGNVKQKYFDGIEDPSEEELRSAFLDGNVEIITLNEQLLTPDDVSFEFNENGGAILSFRPGLFTYGAEYEVVVEYDVFGVRYTYNVSFQTAAAPFELVTTPYVKESIADPFTYDGKNAEARGNLASLDGSAAVTYQIEDMYFSKYYRVDGDLSGEEEGSAEVVFEWEECTDVYGPAGKGTPVGGDTSAAVSEGEGAYVLDPSKKLTWGGFTGRCFILKASLEVAGVPVGKEVSFLMWTRRPVEFEEGEIVISAERMPAEDKTFNMAEELAVYGVVNGVLDKTFNVLVDTPKRIYPGMEITYLFDNMKATINDKPYILEKNTDYILDPNKPGTITFIGDNVVGRVTIEIAVELRNQLDYGHLYDEYTDPSDIFLYGGVQRKTVRIELNQQ